MLLIRLVERKWLLNSTTSCEGNNKIMMLLSQMRRERCRNQLPRALLVPGAHPVSPFESKRPNVRGGAGRGSRDSSKAPQLLQPLPGEKRHRHSFCWIPRLGSHRAPFFYQYLKDIFTSAPAKRETPTWEREGGEGRKPLAQWGAGPPPGQDGHRPPPNPLFTPGGAVGRLPRTQTD